MATTGKKAPRQAKQPAKFNFCIPIFTILVILVALLMYLVQEPKAEYLEMPNAVLKHHEEGHEYAMFDANRRKINVFVHRQGPREGETVFFVHDQGFSSFSFRTVIPLLVSDGIQTIAFDLPGAGLSDKPSDTKFTWRYYSEIIAEVANSLNVFGGFHLVLCGVAGPIGADFAIRHPRHVRSITFVNSFIDVTSFHVSFPYWLYLREPVGEWILRLATSQATVVTPVVWGMRRLRSAASATIEGSMAHHYLVAHKSGRHAFLSVLNGYNTTFQHATYLRHGLNDLGLPMMMISSTGARTSTRARQEYLRQKLPFKFVHVLDGKEEICEDAPVAFANAVIDFVRSLPPVERPPPPVEEPMPHDHGHGHGHGHDHGHHGHGHGHGHVGGYGMGGSNYGL